MKHITRNINTLILISLAIFFTSCKKESSTVGLKSLPSSSKSSSGILVFSDYQEFIETSDKISKMNPEDLEIFEKTMGYTSFGKKCDDVYNSFDSENATQEDFDTFLANNNKYIQIIKDEEGEKTMETNLYDNSLRYLLNINRMYIIGDFVFKVFKEGVLYTNKTNYSQIVGIESEDLDKYKVDPNYKFESYNISGAKDVANNCGIYTDGRATNGSDRTYIRVSVDTPTNPNGGLYLRTVSGVVRPYHKTLGIWFWCKRHITANYNLNVDFINNDGKWDRKNYQLGCNNIYTTSFSCYYQFYSSHVETHFGGYHCWGRTPSTSNVIINCGI